MGGGDRQIHALIDAVYTTPSIRQRLKGFVSIAKYNNISRRIINEQSSVYNVIAKRTVAGKDNNDRYRRLQRDARQHEIMQRVNRWGNLHRNLAVGFTVRDEGFRRVPVMRVVTPDCFFAVSHPRDATRLIAIGIEHRSADGSTRWVVWSDTEVFEMNAEGLISSASIQQHGLRRSPWILFSIEPPHGSLLDSTTMEDLAAAHRAEWFLQVRILKESKSATKIPVIQGDEVSMARGQAADSEGVLVLPQGTNTTSIDMSVDRAPFEKTSNFIYETAAANNGIPPTILHHAGVQSAEARELMRIPLMELRREQTIPLREFERELVDVQEMVTSEELPDLAFANKGWSVDFRESRTPLDPKTAIEVFEHSRRLGLTDTIEYMMERNPDLTEEQAIMQLRSHIDRELKRNILMRPLQAISGSTGATVPAAGANGRGMAAIPDQQQGDTGQRVIGQQSGQTTDATPATRAIGGN